MSRADGSSTVPKEVAEAAALTLRQIDNLLGGVPHIATDAELFGSPRDAPQTPADGPQSADDHSDRSESEADAADPVVDGDGTIHNDGRCRYRLWSHCLRETFKLGYWQFPKKDLRKRKPLTLAGSQRGKRRLIENCSGRELAKYTDEEYQQLEEDLIVLIELRVIHIVDLDEKKADVEADGLRCFAWAPKVVERLVEAASILADPTASRPMIRGRLRAFALYNSLTGPIEPLPEPGEAAPSRSSSSAGSSLGKRARPVAPLGPVVDSQRRATGSSTSSGAAGSSFREEMDECLKHWMRRVGASLFLLGGGGVDTLLRRAQAHP
jgi:hypothetical protein